MRNSTVWITTIHNPPHGDQITISGVFNDSETAKADLLSYISSDQHDDVEWFETVEVVSGYLRERDLLIKAETYPLT